VFLLGNSLKSPALSFLRLYESLKLQKQFVEKAEKLEFSAVVATNFSNYLTAFVISKLKKAKLIIFWHDLLGLNWIKYFGFLGFVGLFIEIVAKSIKAEHWANSNTTGKKLGCSYKEVSLLATPSKSYSASTNIVKKKLGRILMVSRLVNYKRVDLAIKIFYQVQKVKPHTNLVIVGSGPEKGKIENLISKLNLSKSVKLLSGVSSLELANLYKESEVFLHLSKIEGYCLVVQEALNAGCKVVASYLPVLEETTKGNKNAILLNDADVALGLINSIGTKNFLSKIIIAIPTFNRPKELERLLKALAKQENCSKFLITIFNDGANPDTRLVVNRFKSLNINYLESSKNVGPVEGRNRILNSIKISEKNENIYVAFLDDDVVVKEDFVFQIERYSKVYEGFCFRQEEKGNSSIADLKNNTVLKHIFNKFIGSYSPWVGLPFGGFYIDTGKIHKIKHMNGGCLIYNFTKYQNTRFDKHFSLGSCVLEDADFGLSLYKNGANLRYISLYSYQHIPATHGGLRQYKTNTKKFFYYFRNKYLLFQKNQETPIQLLSYLFFFFLELVFLSLSSKKNLIPEFKDVFKRSSV